MININSLANDDLTDCSKAHGFLFSTKIHLFNKEFCDQYINSHATHDLTDPANETMERKYLCRWIWTSQKKIEGKR